MASLLCVFVLNIFFPDNIYGGMAQAVYLPFQLLAATVLFESKRNLLRLVLLFAVLLVICRALDLFFIKNIQNELLLLYIAFSAASCWKSSGRSTAPISSLPRSSTPLSAACCSSAIAASTSS
ncbi:MAG: hypothetical protein U0M13_08635 [Desulfovibrio fairfieldensis]|nr:hypothetical protein [Desulfovibrio fairfieldensis]